MLCVLLRSVMVRCVYNEDARNSHTAIRNPKSGIKQVGKLVSMYVSMYLCTCLCIYVRIYVSMYVSMYLGMYLCTYLFWYFVYISFSWKPGELTWNLLVYRRWNPLHTVYIYL